jgi:hypothetical protein
VPWYGNHIKITFSVETSGAIVVYPEIKEMTLRQTRSEKEYEAKI